MCERKSRVIDYNTSSGGAIDDTGASVEVTGSPLSATKWTAVGGARDEG